MSTPPGQSKKYDIDPAPCNALTLTQHGLRVPRTDYTGIAPGGNVGPERSVDIDVQVEEGCPRSVTIGARLTPKYGEAVGQAFTDLTNVPAGQWTPIPDAQITLPDAGVYEVTGVLRGQFASRHGVDTDAWMSGRLFNVTAGSPVQGTEVLIIYRRDDINHAIGSTATTVAFVRTTGPTVIRAEVVQHLGRQVAPASEVIASHVWSDANGRVKVAYKKIGD